MSDAVYSGPRRGTLSLIPLCLALWGTIVPVGTVEGGAGSAAMATQSDSPLRIIIMGIAYVFSFLLILTGPAHAMQTIKRLWPVLLLLFLAASSALWSAKPERVAVFTLHTLGLLMVSIPAAQYAMTRRAAMLVPVLLALVPVLVASILVARLVPSIGVDPALNRWRGVTASPNNLGEVSLIAMWASLGCLYLTKRILMKVLSLLAIALSLVALVGSGSATSGVISVVMIPLVIVFMSMRKNNSNVRMVKIVMLAIFSVAMLLTVVFILPDLLDPKFALKLIGRSSNFSGRSAVWAMALDAIQMKPLTGWSFDSNASIVMFLRGNMPYAQFHNGYLDIAVRGGLIGLFLLLIILVRMFISLIRLSRINFELYALIMPWFLAMMLLNMMEAQYFTGPAAPLLILLICWMIAEGHLMEAARVAGASNTTTKGRARRMVVTSGAGAVGAMNLRSPSTRAPG